jgi:hypothetical protein
MRRKWPSSVGWFCLQHLQDVTLKHAIDIYILFAIILYDTDMAYELSNAKKFRTYIMNNT